MEFNMNYDLRIKNKIKYWQKKLEISNYDIEIECISIFQVLDNFSAIGNNFIGICTDHIDKKALLYHTRRLREDDILHELLHVRYPLWSEVQINQQVEVLLNRSVN